ncbi:MAG: hypothetical protein ABFD92_03845 [Planctomycetaceae bacterium]|nr:hypothetical protein [Planctomycetaceae bacterium]
MSFISNRKTFSGIRNGICVGLVSLSLAALAVVLSACDSSSPPPQQLPAAITAVSQPQTQPVVTSARYDIAVVGWPNDENGQIWVKKDNVRVLETDIVPFNPRKWPLDRKCTSVKELLSATVMECSPGIDLTKWMDGSTYSITLYRRWFGEVELTVIDARVTPEGLQMQARCSLIPWIEHGE